MVLIIANKEEIAMRIITENRTKLETVIPLSTPFVIFIDPANVCNKSCSYCPTGNPSILNGVNRKPAIMAIDLFKKIIDQCCEFPDKIKTLRLYKDGEPLLNDSFSEMVSYAKRKNKFGSVDTTTNGSILSKAKSFSIVNAGLDRINISVPKNYGNEYLDNVAWLYEYGKSTLRVFAKIAGDYLTEDEREKFLLDFKNITHECAIEHTAPCWPGFDAGSVNLELGIYGQGLSEEVMVCPYIFYQMAVNADGTVSICFLDWEYGNIIGDLRTDNIVDVWNGELLDIVRTIQLRKLRPMMFFCKGCRQLQYGMPDNIDRYAVEILKKMKKMEGKSEMSYMRRE